MIFLLDLDGTLIDSFSRHGLLLESILQKYAPAFHIQTADYTSAKRSGKNNYQYLTEYLGLPEDTTRKICDEWVGHIENPEWLQYDKLYSDAKPFLQLIKSRDDKIIFLSARHDANGAYDEVKHLGIDQYADDVIIVNKNAKYQTKSEYIQHLLADTMTPSLQQSPECGIIMVGDTEDDFNAASANQIPFFILNRGFRSSEYLAKILKVPESFADLTTISRRIYE